MKRIKYFFERRRVNRKHNRLEKSWILLFGIVILLIGALLISCTYIFRDYLNEMIMPVLQNLGQIFISVSVTAILFEKFGYVDYAVKRLCETFTHDEIIKSLNKKKKREFKAKLEKDLFLGCCEDEDSIELLNQIDSDMNTLLSDYYYSEYITYVDFFIEDDKKYITKRIRRTFTVKPVISGNKCSLSTLLFLRTSRLGEEKDNLKISMLKVNETILKENEDFLIEQTPKEKEVDSYDVEYVITPTDKKIIEFTENLNVDITYETIVDYADKIYAITIDRPCAHFCSHFNIDTKKYNINLKSYGFMCFGKDNKNRRREIKTFNGVMIRFLTWILPGDGVVSVISEK